MKVTYLSLLVFVMLLLTATACSSPGQVVQGPSYATNPPVPLVTDTSAPSPTATIEPSPTATSEPSPTATPIIQPLDIVEWAEYPYANLVDPQNTDTHVEILVRNSNDFPVRVELNEVELKFLNAAGDVVYSNPNPTFHFWEGSWIRGGETLPISACVCFNSSGLEKQAWDKLELVVPIEMIEEIAFTTDVEVSIGEFFSLEEAHLGGDMLGTQITLVNTGDQVLKSFEVLITARNSNSEYVGAAVYGSFIDRNANGEHTRIEPGASADGIVVSEIDYFDDPLNYEVTAIGILAGE